MTKDNIKKITNAKTITYNEFSTWLVELITAKQGVLPDTKDWKQIKRMMSKVVPDVKIKNVPSQPRPYIRQPKINPPPIREGCARITRSKPGVGYLGLGY